MDKTGIKNLISAIVLENPRQEAELNATIEFLSGEESEALESFLEFLVNEKGLSFELLAASYNLLSSDTLEEQIYFLKNGKYRHSSYAEIADSVYGNPDYMEKYMRGLMLTEFLWMNHVLMSRWFAEKLPTDRKGAYLEIGPGHGYHMLKAMRRCSFDSYEGVDISPTSVEMTRALLSHYLNGENQRFQIFEDDFLSRDFDRQYDAVVMGEVLEHVENPVAFLQKAARIASDNAFIYIATAINTPAVDHIYLFDSPQAVEDVVTSAGLSVKDRLLTPYKQNKLDKCLRMRLPVSIALVIGKA